MGEAAPAICPWLCPLATSELHASVDLSPFFGLIEGTSEVHIVSPAANILDQRISELSSKDENTRRLALIDLRYFKEEGEKVVPAFIGALEDESPTIRMVALSVLQSYPEQAAGHVDVLLRFLVEGETISERSNAAYALARVGPIAPEIEKALTDALEGAEEVNKPRFESALTNYRRRAEMHKNAR